MGADAIVAAPKLDGGRSYEKLDSAVRARVLDGSRGWPAWRAGARLFAQLGIIACKRIVAWQRVVARERVIARNRVIVPGRIVI
jgi:hypothetical protein